MGWVDYGGRENSVRLGGLRGARGARRSVVDLAERREIDSWADEVVRRLLALRRQDAARPARYRRRPVDRLRAALGLYVAPGRGR